MRTGNFRFEARTIRGTWLRPRRDLQVLMCEYEGVGNSTLTWGRWWREATADDLNAYREQQAQDRANAALDRAEISRLRARFGSAIDDAMVA